MVSFRVSGHLLCSRTLFTVFDDTIHHLEEKRSPGETGDCRVPTTQSEKSTLL